MTGLEASLVESSSGGLTLAGTDPVTITTEGQLLALPQPGGTVAAVQYRQPGKRFLIPLAVAPHVFPEANHDKPVGQWNTLEVLTAQGVHVHVLNGRVVLAASEAQRWQGLKAEPLTEGRVQLLSLGAEVFFRRVALRPLTEVPAALRK
jgi:hypothetical protein